MRPAGLLAVATGFGVDFAAGAPPHEATINRPTEQATRRPILRIQHKRVCSGKFAGVFSDFENVGARFGRAFRDFLRAYWERRARARRSSSLVAMASGLAAKVSMTSPCSSTHTC